MFFIIDMKTKIHILEETNNNGILTHWENLFKVISASGEAET